MRRELEDFLLVAVIGFLSALVGAWTAWGLTDDAWKAEAVRCGFAEWKIVDQETGRTKFEWLHACPAD